MTSRVRRSASARSVCEAGNAQAHVAQAGVGRIGQHAAGVVAKNAQRADQVHAQRKAALSRLRSTPAASRARASARGPA